jgi:hypothetical protein
MTPGTLLVRFPAHSYDFSKSPYHPLNKETRKRLFLDEKGMPHPGDLSQQCGRVKYPHS